jgi:hypothetical protein
VTAAAADSFPLPCRRRLALLPGEESEERSDGDEASDRASVMDSSDDDMDGSDGWGSLRREEEDYEDEDWDEDEDEDE